MGDPIYHLEGKVAVVTGGSRGIGLAIAQGLLQQGARVAICARKQEGLDAAVTKLGGGENVLAVQGHIAKEADVDGLFDKALGHFGTVDILVNNVGMNVLSASVVDTDPALWGKLMETNLSGAFLCARRAAMVMRDKKQGKIVNVSSLAGSRATPGMGAYGIAKAALEMLTRVLAAELAAFNVQVNAVAPGMVKTDFSKLLWSTKEIHDQVVRSIPAGRIAETADVVYPILFLCSRGADFVTGQILMVDGGASII